MEQGVTIEQCQMLLRQLRNQIDQFDKTRAKVNKLLSVKGGSVAPGIVQHFRDAQAEQRAIQDLETLNRLILGRDPSPEELQAGFPEVGNQLGVLPLLPVAAVAGGALALTAVYSYLQGRESRLLSELQGSSWLFPAIIILGIGIGGFILYRTYFSREKNAVRRPPDGLIDGETGELLEE